MRQQILDDMRIMLHDRKVASLYFHDMDQTNNIDDSTVSVTLAPTEIERANSYHRSEDAIAFLKRRIWLRTILARYIGCHPAVVRFAYNKFGKPYLSNIHNQETLHFSISHCSRYSALAISNGLSIGIDIAEPFLFDPFQIVSTILSANEIELLLNRYPDSRRQDVLLSAWTCKEALTKAWGCGLMIDPREIDTDLSLHHPKAGYAQSTYQDTWSLLGFQLEDIFCTVALSKECRATRNKAH